MRSQRELLALLPLKFLLPCAAWLNLAEAVPLEWEQSSTTENGSYATYPEPFGRGKIDGTSDFSVENYVSINRASACTAARYMRE